MRLSQAKRCPAVIDNPITVLLIDDDRAESFGLLLEDEKC